MYDEIKRKICEEHGIAIIEIHPTELDFATITAKIGDKLPLIPLPEQSSLIRELHGMCYNYALNAKRSAREP